jgi:hypothetical protein
MWLYPARSLLFFAASGLLGCKAKPSATATPAPPEATAAATPSASAAPPYRARPVTDGHAIEIHVDYAGPRRGGAWTVPAEYRAHCGGAASVPNQALDVVDGTLVNGAMVWLDDVREGEPPPTADVTQDERDCLFLPHVMAASVGGKLLLTNSDPANHAVRLDFEGAPALDPTTKLLPPDGRAPLEVLPEWAGRVAHVTCPIHLWMSAWVFFFDHPYFALTKAGVARMENVPPGTYHLDVWHEPLDATFDGELHESAPSLTRVEVTIADADVVRAFTLGEDGALTPREAAR